MYILVKTYVCVYFDFEWFYALIKSFQKICTANAIKRWVIQSGWANARDTKRM